MTHKEKAVNYFSQKLHCSQSVLAAFAKECSITEEEAFKLGSCFGSGMRKGQVSNKVNDLMLDRFKEKCGSYICNDLLGCDVSTAEGVQYCRDNKLFTEFCPKMVAAAVEVVEEIAGEFLARPDVIFKEE